MCTLVITVRVLKVQYVYSSRYSTSTLGTVCVLKVQCVMSMTRIYFQARTFFLEKEDKLKFLNKIRKIILIFIR